MRPVSCDCREPSYQETAFPARTNQPPLPPGQSPLLFSRFPSLPFSLFPVASVSPRDEGSLSDVSYSESVSRKHPSRLSSARIGMTISPVISRRFSLSRSSLICRSSLFTREIKSPIAPRPISCRAHTSRYEY